MRDILFGLFVLGSVLVVLAQHAEEYKVTSLPGIDIDDLNFTQYAGHIELDSSSNANVFFWMIESEIKTEPEKLIIWLNGGPGCSSMDGLFLENGPFRVESDLTLTVNEGGWQNYATNIYVDQPVGTGFSFTSTDSYMRTMDEISDHFVAFVDKLFVTFPKLSQQDFYIAGESFAGQYIPYFTAKLLELNKKKKDQEKYNLQGIAIGNGWISAEHQYNGYYDFGVKHNLVDADRLPLMSAHLKTCQEDIKDKETIHIRSCERIMSDIVDSSIHEDKNGVQKCINMYDIRLKEEDSPYCGLSWPYELDDVTKYLRLPEVKKAIHAEKQPLGWKECTSLVQTALNGDKSQPAYYLLPRILKEIPVLLYSGEYDLICNYIGTEYLIGNMTWNGGSGFTKKRTKKEIWKIDNKLAGYYTQERNLTYVLIKDGSHMVPYDRPIECLDMINRFMQVGNNVVKGRKSQVGEQVVSPSPSASASASTPLSTADKSEQTTTSDEQKDNTSTGDDKWDQYYSWGTATLVLVILFAISLCWCWLRGRNRPSPASVAAEFGGAPQREREGVKKRGRGILGFVGNLFGFNKANDRKKFRLGDNEESNELDELVIETPMLFEAEEFDDDDHHHDQQQQQKHTNRFAIDDDEDDEDDFEDFADFDDGEALTSSTKK